jgi:hypothetical protein
MRILTFKRALFGMLVTLFLSASLLRAATEGALVDNFTGGTNENQFENYWYYYDDNGGTKALDRPQKAPPESTQSVINVPYGKKNRLQCGNPNDTFKLNDYQFLIKDDAGNKYGCMPFTLGKKWDCGTYIASPFCGIGTELIPDGKFVDLTKPTAATSVTFRLRSHVNTLKINFRMETMDVIRDSSFAYFYAQKSVAPGSWVPCEVIIPTDLAQPTWAKGDQIKTSLLVTQVAKLSWEVHGEVNTGVKSDTLDIDDVVLKGYTFVSPTVWTPVAAARPATGLFGDFQAADYKNSTPLNTYWYGYDDQDIGGNSTVLVGATKNVTAKTLSLDFTAGTGYNNAGFGAAVKLQCGKTVRKANAPGDTVDVKGFIGIGANLYDSMGAVYLNATTGKMGNLPPAPAAGGSANSIYFEYSADGDFKYMTLEVSDFNDVPDKNAPTRKDTRGSGIVWYRNFPQTGKNIWARVEIPFDSLITHSTWKGYKAIPLDKTKLAKVQFKVQGAESQGGTIMIDNVYMPGIDFGKKESSIKNSVFRSGQQSAFRAFYRNGKVRVDWRPVNNLMSGKISLIDSKGMIVKSDRVASGATLSMEISTDKLPAGLYLVHLNGLDAAGKEIARQTAVTVLQ